MKYVAAWLALIIIIVFVLQQLLGTELFVLESSVKWSEPWRLVTSVFAHGGIVHLLNNLFGLLLFGLILEGTIGSKKVLWLFAVTGFVVNLLPLYDSSLGASGAIFGIMGALVALRPTMTMWVHMMPMPMYVAGILWLIQDIFGVFYPSGVGNLAHISGLFIGLGIGLYWRREFAEKKKPKKRKDPMVEDIVDQIEETMLRR